MGGACILCPRAGRKVGNLVNTSKVIFVWMPPVWRNVKSVSLWCKRAAVSTSPGLAFTQWQLSLSEVIQSSVSLGYYVKMWRTKHWLCNCHGRWLTHMLLSTRQTPSYHPLVRRSTTYSGPLAWSNTFLNQEFSNSNYPKRLLFICPIVHQHKDILPFSTDTKHSVFTEPGSNNHCWETESITRLQCQNDFQISTISF